MRKKRDNYQYPRCGYDVENKYCMRRHFYISKNICPALDNNIELTQEIKEYVLANRIYKPKQNLISTPEKVEFATKDDIQKMYDFVDSLIYIGQGDIKNFSITDDSKVNKLKYFRCGERNQRAHRIHSKMLPKLVRALSYKKYTVYKGTLSVSCML